MPDFDLLNARVVPEDMSREEFLMQVEAKCPEMKLCPICGYKASLAIAVGGDPLNSRLISALVICTRCHCNALSKRNTLKRWFASVGEAVNDWNTLKGDKTLCLKPEEFMQVESSASEKKGGEA